LRFAVMKQIVLRRAMRYLQGDATLPQGAGAKLIIHVVNDRGGWGKGFVLALAARYPAAEAAYRRWSRQPTKADPPFALGAVQFVDVAPDIWIANTLAQHGYRSSTNPVPLDYVALSRGLGTVAAFATEHDLSVHMPRIGAGLAGGDWNRIAAMIEEQLYESDITIYDLSQR
jgi:O-acetyl-ADP-ribose deacetylase (regulator of RNase III)